MQIRFRIPKAATVWAWAIVMWAYLLIALAAILTALIIFITLYIYIEIFGIFITGVSMLIMILIYAVSHTPSLYRRAKGIIERERSIRKWEEYRKEEH